MPLTILHSLESDVNEIESQDKIVLNAIESVLIAEDTKDGLYFDDMEYSPEISAQNLGRKFNVQYDLTAREFNELSQYEYFIITPKKNNKSIVFLHQNDCKKQNAIAHWEDGIVDRITYKSNTYKIGYNEAGLVRSLEDVKKKNKSIIKNHILTYTEDGKIESVTAKSKNYNQNTEPRLTSKTTYQYTENKIEIASKNYSKEGKMDINRTTFILEDLGLTRINYRANDKSTIASTDETILNEIGQVIRRVHTKPGRGNTSIESFEYNEQGQVIRTSSLIATENSIVSHKESLYSYTQPDESDKIRGSNCQQNISMIHSIYDEEGNLADTFTEKSL